jgi:hypothetical protein
MKIGLGTIQFGQNYGASNKQGITAEDEHLNGLGVEIHSLSVSLQELLLMHPDNLPKYFQSVHPYC